MKTTRRQVLKAAAASAVPFAVQSEVQAGSQKRPNVMVIHCHDMGRHLGCYGRGVETPHLDRLASEGVRFTNYFSTAPFCSPSRCSRLTGFYPCNHGSIGSTSFAWGIRKGLKTLPMLLNEQGYETHLFGLQHEARDGSSLGYQHYEHGSGSPGASTRAFEVSEKVVEFLRRRPPDGSPFYMDVGFSEAHMGVPRGGYEAWKGPGAPPRFNPAFVGKDELDRYHGQLAIGVTKPFDPYRRKYSPDEIQPLPYLPDRRGIREDLADLNELVTNVIDPSVGQILEALDATGLAQDTLVIYTTDHGIDMPRAKGTLYDSGVEVALLMRYPKRFPAGKVHDAMLSHVDFLPTVVEAAGGRPPGDIDGRSFLPLILGESYEEREEIFLENTWHGFYDPMRGIRTKQFKYIRNFDPKKHYWAVESKAAREVLGEVCFGIKPLEELYDLSKDPHERENLASSRTMLALMGGQGRNAGAGGERPEVSKPLTELRQRLRAHMRETDDPLLRGPVPHQCYDLIWDES